MQAWLRTSHGLVHCVDTDPQLHKAIPTLIAACHPLAATASESAYQTQKSTLESGTALKMVVSDNHIALTAANPGR